MAVKYREIIADNLSEAGWSWGCVSAIDSNGRAMWIVDAHRDGGKRFVVHADELLTAFGELEAEISHAQASADPVAACQARPYKLRCNIRLSKVLIEMSSITSSEVSS
jgi:hypothetical protein